MKFPWHSDKKKAVDGVAGGSYRSESVVASRTVPGVKFTIAKMSFGRRVELMRRVRELARRTEFLAASEEAAEKMDSALLHAEIERLYVMWGVKAVSGLAVGNGAIRLNFGSTLVKARLSVQNPALARRHFRV